MNQKAYKAGIFVLLTLGLLAVLILRVGQGSLFSAGTYELHLVVDNASGLADKTPVQIAGVPVGVVTDIELDANSRARLTLRIKNKAKVFEGAVAQIKTQGILGDAYIDILQPQVRERTLPDGAEIVSVQSFGDLSSLTDVMGQIADDVKAITSQMRKLMAGDDSTFDNSMRNIEKITAYLAKNENNVNASMNNIKAITENLNAIIAANRSQIYSTTSNLAEITQGLNAGEGTLGRLIKNDETLDKIHESLDNLNGLLGSTNRFEVKMGGHTEYLGGTGDFKNYVTLALQPRPDKYFLFEVISDPNPSFTTTIEQTTVTTGGSSSTVTTEKLSKELNDLLFSAQFAKKFQDFTVRGGLIESTGGVGFDYNKGPFGAEFSAFDFKNSDNQKPHLKILGTAKVTKTFYLLGGLDDFLNQEQDLDWFFGAGFNFTDEDVKSLFGLVGLSGRP